MSRKIEQFISEEQIEKRIAELGKQITEDYKGKDILLVGILKGSVPFLCSLMWKIDNEKLAIDFMDVSSYGSGTESSGDVKILKDIDSSIKGKNVIIVEDILDKPERRVCDVKPDYIGFEIENRFVAGFGLDDDQYMRQLKYVGEVIFE